MERRYSETTRKRRRLCKGIVLMIILLFIGRFLGGTVNGFVKGVLEFGMNRALPLIFSYKEEGEKEKAPFWVKMIAPSVVSYVWKEETFIEQGEASVQVQTYISVPTSEVVSLIQENLFQAEREQDGENNVESPEKLWMDDVLIEGVQLENQKLFRQYDLSQYQELSELIKEFYIVDASTVVGGELLNVERLTDFDCTLEKEVEGPQILIYHSHSQEEFADSVEGDENTTIVGAGKKLTRLLEEEYGYQVLHHKGIYDVPSRDNAYANALPAIEQILEENPTIQVVIDLHRDAVAEGTKLVTNIDGRDYARFMFFNGVCRSTSGPITYLNNPFLQENLAFSFQAQLIAEGYFPGITRKIYLKAWRYNMHLKPRNMLIELGAQTNTVEEVMNTTEILAFVIDKVLSGQQ